MLTVYSNKSSFKKKLTVVVIWLVALALAFLLVEVISYKEISFFTKVFPVIIGILMIAGILLRCKIARGATLVTLYSLALFPLIANVLTTHSFIIFSVNNSDFFNEMEVFLTNAIWALLFIIPIYFFSNNKSMEIFYIEPNPKEHFFFLLGAIVLVFAYVRLFL
jgi:hypothetical protein